MRCLRRNMTSFEYLPYSGTETDLNEKGEHTGEFHPEYGTAVSYKGNISIPSGQTVQQFYGKEIRYTHTLVMDNPNAEIDEMGVIRWNGGLYDIKAVRRSINSLSAALREQTENYEDPPEPTPGPDPTPGSDEPDDPDDPVNPNDPVEPDDTEDADGEEP